MLLQSYAEALEVFPAIPPPDWADVSFRDLRAEGAFLMSAVRKHGTLDEVRIKSEKGGLLRIANPFGDGRYVVTGGRQPTRSS